MDAEVIVIDLDNTLLHTDKTISDYSIDVLNRCREAGKIIVFATARSTQASLVFLERYKPDIFVGYGGALVTIGDEVIYRFDISEELSSMLLRDFLNAKEISSILAINENVALTNSMDVLAASGHSHYIFTDSFLDYDYRYLKLSVMSTSQDVIEGIAANYPMCDMLRYAGEDLYRFANREAIKWNAVKAIANHYGLSTDAFVAFGDDINDLEMITNCGVGIAMANALDEVKDCADCICDSNDNDGVARWLENNLL